MATEKNVLIRILREPLRMPSFTEIAGINCDDPSTSFLVSQYILN